MLKQLWCCHWAVGLAFYTKEKKEFMPNLKLFDVSSNQQLECWTQLYVPARQLPQTANAVSDWINLANTKLTERLSQTFNLNPFEARDYA